MSEQSFENAARASVVGRAGRWDLVIDGKAIDTFQYRADALTRASVLNGHGTNGWDLVPITDLGATQ